MKKVIQIIIGLISIFSGLIKALDTASFSQLIGSYGLGWIQNLAPLISATEIILGLCLILNINTRLLSAMVGIITILLTLAFAYAFFFKGITDCGCMGSLIDVPPVVSFIRNFLVIIGCFWIWRISERKALEIKKWKQWTIYFTSCLALGLAAFTFGIPLIDKNKINEGDDINSSILKPYRSIISNDINVIFVFSPNCLHCWNVTENVNSIKNISEFKSLLGITFQNVDTTVFMKEMRPNFKVYVYPTQEINKIIKEVPTLLITKKGKIIKIFMNNEIPCGKVLKKMLEKELNDVK